MLIDEDVIFQLDFNSQMTVLGDGYFGLHIDGTLAVPNSITNAIASISFLIHCMIGILAFRKMSHQQNVDRRLKILFTFSWLCCITYNLSQIVGTIMALINGAEPMICVLLFCITWFYFYWTLLATLILRLHITFKHSAYRMTRTMYIFHFIILSIWFLIIAFHPFLFLSTFRIDDGLAHDALPEWFLEIAYGLSTTCVGLFLLGSFVALRFFVNNLWKIAAARTVSQTKLSVDSEEVELDAKQQRLIDLSARNVMLFVIAAISTVIASLAAFVFNMGSGLRKNAFAIDSAVNIWCLFLQFACAAEYYQIWCGCCDRRCSELISRRTKRAIHMQSLSRESLHIMESLRSSNSVNAEAGSNISSVQSSYRLMET